MLLSNFTFLRRWSVSDIIISDVQRRDDGLYECQARNEGGAFFKSGHIQVRDAEMVGKKGSISGGRNWNGPPLFCFCDGRERGVREGLGQQEH